MTKIDEEFLNRKRELLRKNKETSTHMVDMVNDMATRDAVELIHAIFEVLRHTEPLGGSNHTLDTKYAKDVVNLLYGYQNRYLSTFLMACGHEIRGLEKAAQRVEKRGIRDEYLILREIAKEGRKFLEELVRQEEEEEKKNNSKESIGPQNEEGAGERGERDKI